MEELVEVVVGFVAGAAPLITGLFMTVVAVEERFKPVIVEVVEGPLPVEGVCMDVVVVPEVDIEEAGIEF